MNIKPETLAKVRAALEPLAIAGTEYFPKALDCIHVGIITLGEARAARAVLALLDAETAAPEYRLLDAGEPLQDGDQFLHPAQGWVIAYGIGKPVPENFAGRYRRPVKGREEA